MASIEDYLKAAAGAIEGWFSIQDQPSDAPGGYGGTFNRVSATEYPEAVPPDGTVSVQGGAAVPPWVWVAGLATVGALGVYALSR